MINVTQSSNDTKNLFSKFSNVDFSSKQSYMVNAYANKKIHYYNDEKEIKRKNTKKKLVLGTTSLVLLSAVAFAFGSKKFKIPNTEQRKNLRNIIENFGNNTNNIKDEIIGKIINFIDEKTPFKFIKRAFNKTSDWYRSNVYKAVKGKFEKAQKAILEAEGGKAFEGNLKNFDEMYQSLDNGIKQTAQKEKLTTSKLFEGNENKIKNLWNNLIHPLADSKIANTINQNANLIQLPDNASESLKKAIENYNKLQKEEIIPKLRDIAYGAAPSDIITAAIPIATFGMALAKSDDKEERKSLLLNLGIPLFPSVTMPILGTIFPILNGIKAMVIGFAVGSVFSSAAKFLDNKLKKNKAAENRI